MIVKCASCKRIVGLGCTRLLRLCELTIITKHRGSGGETHVTEEHQLGKQPDSQEDISG